MDGPQFVWSSSRHDKALLVVLVLASTAGCSFDARGLGQSGEDTQRTGGPDGATSGTGEPGSTTGTGPTTAGPAGEASASGETGSTGPVDPGSSTTADPTTTTDTTQGSSTGGETSTGDTTTDGQSSSSSGGCVEKTYYLDADMDGFGATEQTKMACAAPDGHVEKPGDCDDADPQINPAIEETCNEVDDDCDGAVNEYNPPINVDCDDCRMLLYQPNNRVYHFCSDPREWLDARSDCEARAAVLATDVDDAHHAWLLDQLPDASGPWYIGGSSPDKTEKFVWIDGSPVPDPDDRWGFERPGGGAATNRLALVSRNNVLYWGTYNGKWFDRGENDDEPFICESPFEP